VALAAVVAAIVVERRPRQPGQPRLVPTTLILFVSVVVLVLALAHLVTLTTGQAHRGRLGQYGPPAPVEYVFSPGDEQAA